MRKIFLFIIFFFVGFSAQQVRAATLQFSEDSLTLAPESLTEVTVTLRSESSRINAVEGSIQIPEGIFIDEIYTGNSIISYWVEQPELRGNKIIFSGIVPGGYQGGEVKLFSYTFSGVEEGDFHFSFTNPHVFLHDGKASDAVLDEVGMNVRVRRGYAEGDFEQIEDLEPPQIFYPEILQEAEMYNGNVVLIFFAQDKGTGVAYYTVREGNHDPVVATSPYVLQYQRILKEIEVTAYDHAGNKRTVVLHSKDSYRFLWQVVCIIGLIFFVFGIHVFVKRIHKYDTSS